MTNQRDERGREMARQLGALVVLETKQARADRVLVRVGGEGQHGRFADVASLGLLGQLGVAGQAQEAPDTGGGATGGAGFGEATVEQTVQSIQPHGQSLGRRLRPVAQLDARGGEERLSQLSPSRAATLASSAGVNKYWSNSPLVTQAKALTLALVGLPLVIRHSYKWRSTV